MLLKAGIIMMTLALAFAAGVAVYALLDEPMERAIASKPAAKRSLEPLVRSSPLGGAAGRESSGATGNRAGAATGSEGRAEARTQAGAASVAGSPGELADAYGRTGRGGEPIPPL
jgi:hypothetical protein